VFIAVNVNSPGDRNIWVVGATLGVLVLCGAVILWRLPQWQADTHRGELSEKEYFEVENNARATLGSLLGTATLIAGLFFAWQQLGSTNQTVYLSEQGQITERFTRAVDQLGSDDLTIRLGGIYALERIARDSERDAGPVMEVLTAYVRGQVPRQRPGTLATPPVVSSATVPTDVQAVLDVIARRPAGDAPPGQCLDLSNTNLSGAELSSGNLTNLCLWRTDLSEANLGAADLTGTDLTQVNLQDAILQGAKARSVNLVGANLSRANLRDADFTDARLDGTLLSRAILDGAILDGAILVGADLQGAFLFGADFSGAEMADADLTGALLSGALLKDARSLTQDQVDSAVGIDDQTTLPDGIATPSAAVFWPVHPGNVLSVVRRS
jgi:uncharacterized protein YjbI with pentapeptide repeats